jgi:mercuric ion transport protein
MATADKFVGPVPTEAMAGSGTGRPTGKALLAAGSILAAIGASSCCVVPFMLFTLGISGAWIGNLTALAPYQPVFVAAALALLALGFVRVYRKPKTVCVEGSYCAQPLSDRVTKIGLWAAAALVAIAITFPYTARLFLDL